MREALPPDIEAEVFVAPALSSGIGNRLAILRAVGALDADIVHITGDITFAGLARRRRGTVVTVLDCGFARDASGPAAFAFTNLWLRLPARRAERFVAISSFTAQEIARYGGVDASRIDVVPITIDDSYTPQPLPHNSRPVVLCFAHTPNKNAARIGEAVQGLDAELRVVEGGLSDAEMRAAYAEADVVAFPSLVGQALYIRAVELIGPNRAGLFINFLPLWGALLSVLILSEAFEPYHALALLLVLSGVLLAEYGGRRSAAPSP